VSVNIVLITLDCVRPDYLGCYGHNNAVTPNIDSLALQGVLMERTYSHSSVTGPSLMSLFTSRFPFDHGVRFNGSPVTSDLPMIAQILQKNNYRTAAFVGGYMLNSKFGFNNGFDFYDDNMTDSFMESMIFKICGYYKDWGGIKVRKFSRNANRVTDSARKWLVSADMDKPFFMWLHYFDAHDQFRLPQPLHYLYFRRRNYKQNVEFMDFHIGRLIDELKRRNLFENTLFIVTSDHGESLNDYKFQGKDYHGHASFAYDVTLRVPLIFCGPGIGRGVYSKQLFRHVDILPTLLNYLHLSHEADGSFEGKNLLATLKDGSAGDGNEIYAETLVPTVRIPPEAEWRVLIRWPWKFVLRTQSNQEYLFNLEKDPYERNDVFSHDSKVAQDLKKRLEEMLERDKNFSKPDWDDDVRSALEGLGYL
jgi:arylsulfatase A-like enzyme